MTVIAVCLISSNKIKHLFDISHATLLGRVARPRGAPGWPRRLRPSGGVGPRPTRPSPRSRDCRRRRWRAAPRAARSCDIAIRTSLNKHVARAPLPAPGMPQPARTRPQRTGLARAIERCASQREPIILKLTRAPADSARTAMIRRAQRGTAPRACRGRPRLAAARDIFGGMSADPAPRSRSLPEVDGSPYAAIHHVDTLTR